MAGVDVALEGCRGEAWLGGKPGGGMARRGGALRVQWLRG